MKIDSRLACLSLLLVGAPALGQQAAWEPDRPANLDVPATENDVLRRALEAGYLVTDDFEFGALVRAFFAYTDDDLGDLGGFGFNDVDIWIETQLSELDFRISFDAGDGLAELEDAYVSWHHSDAFHLKVGEFKPRVLFSNSVDPELQILNQRTAMGSFFDAWDLGVQGSGRVAENLDYFVSITNGDNGAEDDTLLVLRGEWSVHGGQLALIEGPRGLEDTTEIQVGATFFSNSEDDDTGLGIDVLAHFEKLAGHFEVMNFDDGLAGNAGLVTLPTIDFDGDSTPWALTGSYLLRDDLQGAARVQFLDDDQETWLWTFGAQFFPEQVSVVLNGDVTVVESDADDGVALELGVALGASRKR